MSPTETTTTAAYVDDKAAVQRRLARIEGQVRGVRGMVDDEAYCIDVLTQISAVTKALDGVARQLLADHANHCVRDAVEAGGAEADEKLEELLAAVERFSRTR
jgi:CsoR family transcriptional regulator, copper-sensing transcriptional repressor